MQNSPLPVEVLHSKSYLIEKLKIAPVTHIVLCVIMFYYWCKSMQAAFYSFSLSKWSKFILLY